MKEEIFEEIERLEKTIKSCERYLKESKLELKQIKTFCLHGVIERRADKHFIVEFITDECICGLDRKDTLKSIYGSYVSYCNLKGFEVFLSKVAFSKKISELGYFVFKGTANKTYVNGITLK